MTLLLGKHTTHNRKMCGSGYKMTRPIKNILEDIRKTLVQLGITVVRPAGTVDTICRSLWARDSTVYINGKIVLLPGFSRGRRDEWMTHPGRQRGMKISDPDYLLVPETPENVEGGDVIQVGDTILLGIGKRTNIAGMKWLAKKFPAKTIIPVPHCALHLDCCLTVLPRPPGSDGALGARTKLPVIYSTRYIYDLPEAVTNMFETLSLESIIGRKVVSNLATNILMIKQADGRYSLVTTDQAKFRKFRKYLREQGYSVHEIKYGNMWRYGGGIRCLTQWIEPGDTWIL